ncbi:cupin domain-containing protein [Streptomyces sp. ASQP_92]|uniref:cupin domain-containing protein n=1 Tax=Streptomyces sp. ASQP_92 TaxID=2979116 RepID=UPI0021C2405F|nr:cupin domain-containing protein [Streptomyces sp. ASQP_92]MCT9088820.1 cupin domain-containing protein [Streptomyces sp. ASQP_92]
MGWAALDRLVGEPELLFEACRQGRPQVFRPAVLPQEVPTLRELTEGLSGGLMRTPYVEMVREGAVVPAAEFSAARVVAGGHEEGFADPEQITRLLAEGATLLLPRLDQWNASVGALTALVSQDLRRVTEAFCFATMAGRRGLDVHRDDADVLVVQLAGRKEWTVYDAPADGDRHPRPVPGPGEPALVAVVGAGDVLYVPRGAPHTATGNEGLSVHLALTIREAGTKPLRQTLADLLPEPVAGEPPRPMTEAQLLDTTRELIEAARERMAAVTPGELLERARGPLPATTGAAPAPRPGVG